jgi:hypothetical protein
MSLTEKHKAMIKRTLRRNPQRAIDSEDFRLMAWQRKVLDDSEKKQQENGVILLF